MTINPIVFPKGRTKSFNGERLLGALAVLTILAAWILGSVRSTSTLDPYLKGAFPSAQRFELRASGVYAAFGSAAAADQTPLGYVAVGAANGYGGPIQLAVAVNPQGEITGVSVIDEKETPSFFNRVLQAQFIEKLLGLSYRQPLKVGEDIDAVTGATYTSRALVDSVRQASRQVAAGQLKQAVPPETSPAIKFGVPEGLVVLLYAVGYFGHRPNFKHKKIARWGSMLAGMVILGFVYNLPLTLGKVNSFLMGYWPQWQTNLYWYFLLGGIIFVFSVDNKNPYCEWFCPFGAAQECMGAIGGAKARTPNNYRTWLVWVQRGLAWLAIIIALVFRNPGLTSYEIFGNLFSLTGSMFGFLLLGLILLASLYIRRPWCTYLCPLRPVTDFIRMVRGWFIELWKRNLRKAA